MMKDTYQLVACEPQIFRAYDIRGIVDAQINEDVYFTIGYALGIELKNRQESQVVLAYDGRLTSPQYARALEQGLLTQGIEVWHLGMVPTGLMYFATCHSGIENGLMLTGSHNPKNYNGLKMVLQGQTLQEKDIQKIYTHVQGLAFGSQFIPQEPSYRVWDVVTPYVDYIQKDICLNRPLKVIADYGHGVGAVIGPQLFAALNCEVTGLYDVVDGHFPAHHPDPTVPDNLKDLISALQNSDAEVGIAFDGDADRLGVVTKAGEIIWPDRLMMLFSREVLQRKPRAKIVYDVKCSKQLAEVIHAAGGCEIMAPTGHSLVKGIMKQEQAELAGEMSGHIFFKDRWFGFDDGIYSACRFLEILSQYKGLTELVDTLPQSLIATPEIKIDISEEKKFSFMQEFMRMPLTQDIHAIRIDGLRLEFQEGWGLLRASNTSACLVARFEAQDLESLTRIQDFFKAKIHEVDASLMLSF